MRLAFYQCLVFCLVLCMVSRNGAEEHCGKGWTRFNQSCYIFETDTVDWYTAAERCYNCGGHLARIDSKTEMNFLKQKVKGMTGFFWMDGNDEENEGIWKWSSNGQIIKFTDWLKGKPNHGIDGNCLLLHDSTQKWVDAACLYTSRGYICEKELKSNEKEDCDINSLISKTCRLLKSFLEFC